MSAMANILVKDDTVTTRQEFTLVPVTDTPSPIWRSQIAGVPLEGQILLTLSDEVVKSGAYKMTAKLEVPVMESLGTAGTAAGYVAPAKVAYVNTGIFTMYSNKRATTQNSADLLAMMVGLLQGASSTTATGILSQTSAGNAFVNSTLPIVDAFVKKVKPN